MQKRRDVAMAAAAAAAVAAVLVIGFYYLGSPANQRAMNSDQHRVDDLRNIAQWIHMRPAPLPGSLAELARGSPVHVKDPVSNAPYEYHPESGTVYELCATFVTAWSGDEQVDPVRSAFWNHPRGRHCYHLDAGRALPY